MAPAACSQVTSLEDMRRFVMEHSDFSRAQGVVTKHVNVMSALSEQVAKRHLMDVSTVGRAQRLGSCLMPVAAATRQAARARSCAAPRSAASAHATHPDCPVPVYSALPRPLQRPPLQVEQELANPSASTSAAGMYDTVLGMLRAQVGCAGRSDHAEGALLSHRLLVA